MTTNEELQSKLDVLTGKLEEREHVKLDCGCDTYTGYKCNLHESPWRQAVCPDCGHTNAMRHLYNRKVYCEACGRNDR